MPLFRNLGPAAKSRLLGDAKRPGEGGLDAKRIRGESLLPTDAGIGESLGEQGAGSGV